MVRAQSENALLVTVRSLPWVAIGELTAALVGAALLLVLAFRTIAGVLLQRIAAPSPNARTR